MWSHSRTSRSFKDHCLLRELWISRLLQGYLYQFLLCPWQQKLKAKNPKFWGHFRYVICCALCQVNPSHQSLWKFYLQLNRRCMETHKTKHFISSFNYWQTCPGGTIDWVMTLTWHLCYTDTLSTVIFFNRFISAVSCSLLAWCYRIFHINSTSYDTVEFA